ncbi:MAG TPA: class I SAM-dependent methyltransferase, partial [Candidatus Aminicenantes bacterium]|nr:class I SAM-dependent methyltransferase [Candidatus Aminicenantes bacterium]
HIRSETGFLLSAVNPSEGIGIEVSQEMVDIARERYPQFQFIRSDPEELSMKKKFDYILFSHISDTIDVINAFRHLKNLLEPHTRLIIYTYNHLWQPIIK